MRSESLTAGRAYALNGMYTAIVTETETDPEMEMDPEMAARAGLDSGAVAGAVPEPKSPTATKMLRPSIGANLNFASAIGSGTNGKFALNGFTALFVGLSWLPGG